MRDMSKTIPMDSTWSDLGWANDWHWLEDRIDEPEELTRCRSLGHQRSDVDVGPPHRGIEHVVQCATCKIVYRYDSSD